MATNQPEIVSKVPEITPELLEQNEALQKRWRKQFTPPQISIDAHAERVVQQNLMILDGLEYMWHTPAGKDKQTEIAAQIKRIRIETAEWLATLGRFEAAAKLSPNQTEQARFTAFHEATVRDDNEWCEHPLWKNGNQNAYRERDYYSFTHGKKVSMMRCAECGFRNGRDLDESLQRLSAHRAAVTSATRGLSKEDAARVLKQKGLATTDISAILAGKG